MYGVATSEFSRRTLRREAILLLVWSVTCFRWHGQTHFPEEPVDAEYHQKERIAKNGNFPISLLFPFLACPPPTNDQHLALVFTCTWWHFRTSTWCRLTWISLFGIYVDAINTFVSPIRHVQEQGIRPSLWMHVFRGMTTPQVHSS